MVKEIKTGKNEAGENNGEFLDVLEDGALIVRGAYFNDHRFGLWEWQREGRAHTFETYNKVGELLGYCYYDILVQTGRESYFYYIKT